MLFKFNETLINLDEVKTIWIDEAKFETTPKYMNILNFSIINSSEECIQILCSKDEAISYWNKLKEYKSIFYEIKPDDLINIKNISVLNTYINDENSNIAETIFKDGDVFTYNLNENSDKINEMLKEISKRS